MTNDMPDETNNSMGLTTGKRSKGSAVTVDGHSGELVPIPQRKIRLHDVESVRRELARVYRDIENGKRPLEEGSKRAYMLKTMAELIQMGEWEKRLDMLQREIQGKLQP